MELWNTEAAESLPRCRGLTDKRITHIRRRLSERSVEEWREVIRRINGSPFLLGESSSWRATFDWVIQSPDNALKVLEGKYDGVPRPATHAAPQVPDAEETRRRYLS